MKVIKRIAKVIFNVGKLYFLLATFFLLLGLLFGFFPYVFEFPENVKKPLVNYLPAMYLIIGLIWVFRFGVKGVTNHVFYLADNDSIAFGISLGSLLVIMGSYTLWEEFGLNWWIGILSLSGLLGFLVYLIFGVIKPIRRLR